MLPDDIQLLVEMADGDPNELIRGEAAQVLASGVSGSTEPAITESVIGLVTIYRDDTLDNGSLADLAEDVTDAFARGGLLPILAEMRFNSDLGEDEFVLTSPNDFEIRVHPGVSTNDVDDSDEAQELLDVSASIAADGNLETDLLLWVMVDGTAGGYQGIVTVLAENTNGDSGDAANTSLTDLAADIQQAFADHIGDTDTADDGFEDVLVTVDSGRLLFSGPDVTSLELEVLFTENAHLIGISSLDTMTVVAEREPPLQLITPDSQPEGPIRDVT